MTQMVSAMIGLKIASDEQKARKSAAHAADMKAQELEQKAIDAEQQAQTDAEEKIRKRQASQTQSILTTPLGVQEEAPIKKPTLLGVG